MNKKGGIVEDFRERLEGYVVFKNCFQVPVDWEVDEALVAALLRARLAELDQGIELINASSGRIVGVNTNIPF